MLPWLRPSTVPARLAAWVSAPPDHQPSGRALGLAMAAGVVIGGGGGVVLEISAVTALSLLGLGLANSCFFNALRRHSDISDPLGETTETASHDAILTPALRPRR